MVLLITTLNMYFHRETLIWILHLSGAIEFQTKRRDYVGNL